MGKRLGHALTRLVTGLGFVEKPWRRADTRLRVAMALLPRHRVETRHGALVFVTSHPQGLEYPRDFRTREPETLAWIDGFETPCRFWDIGANIGAYSLYAGLRSGVEVRAFEPAAASYAALCANIEENGLGDRIAAYCLALGERTELGRLNLSGTNAASVYNAFEAAEDCFGKPLQIVFRQGAVGFSLDGFRRLFALPAPNYLKIDVDSTEERILAGAAETLRDPELRSVLLELEDGESARTRRMTKLLGAAGFSLAAHGAPQGRVVNGIFTRAAADRQ
ncbi:MAG TPA: FkbM family methyltransferase [Stellaceae bacterium]|jgi:FkbM family methyltransferase